MQAKANGKVDLWDAEAGAWVEFWTADAIHAVKADPGRFSSEKPFTKPVLVENDDDGDGE